MRTDAEDDSKKYVACLIIRRVHTKITLEGEASDQVFDLS